MHARSQCAIDSLRVLLLAAYRSAFSMVRSKPALQMLREAYDPAVKFQIW